MGVMLEFDVVRQAEVKGWGSSFAKVVCSNGCWAFYLSGRSRYRWHKDCYWVFCRLYGERLCFRVGILSYMSTRGDRTNYDRQTDSAATYLHP